MTDPVLSIEPDRISVEPGGQARVVVTIANPGTIVEGFRVDVVDEVSGRPGGVEGPAEWSEVLPPEGMSPAPDGSVVVSVYPKQQQSVVVVFAPPSGPRTPGGTFPFGVRVASIVDPPAGAEVVSAVVEGDLEIGRVFGLQATLVPVTSAGRWRGGHVVRVSNWGNAPARLHLVPSDPDLALGFLIRPEIVELPLGSTVSARISVRTRRPKLRGTVARLPFSIVGEPVSPQALRAPVSPVTTPERPVVDGAFTQKPILSRTVVMGAAVAGAAAVVLTALGLQGASAEDSAPLAKGAPATPNVKAAPAAPTKIRLSWTPVSGIKGYTLLRLTDSGAAEGTDELDKELGEHVVEELESSTKYCFQMIAVGAVESPKSKQACARTAKAPNPPGPAGPAVPPKTSETKAPVSPPQPARPVTPPTDGSADPAQFEGGKWIAIVSMYFDDMAADPRKEAFTRRDVLKDAGIEKAGVLYTKLFPSMSPPAKIHDWRVYLGPYESELEARDACAQMVQDHPSIKKTGSVECERPLGFSQPVPLPGPSPSTSSETQPSLPTQTP